MGPQERDEFRTFLKRGGRSASAQDRCLRFVAEYEDFLLSLGSDIGGSGPDELHTFVEQGSTDWAKTRLWALKYYFEFTDDEALAGLANTLRQSMITRKPFRLDEFVGVDSRVVVGLGGIGVTDSGSLLERGSTSSARRVLAEQSGLELSQVEEMVKLADLARLPGVKAIRARLYLDSGVDTLEDLAGWDPEDLYHFLVGWVEESSFDGVAPTPGEVAGTHGTARRLPKLIEWD